jgi:hypothetical protein
MLDTIKRVIRSVSIRDVIWYLGIPYFVALMTFGPFLLMRCIWHPVAGASCLRLFSVGQLVFDLHAYMEFVGGVFSHAGGIHLKGVDWLFRAIRYVMPWASITEMWLILRWFFGVLSWWMFSWMLSFFTNCTLLQRRFAASILWIAVFLPLGFRPGVFSWFVPFGLVMFVGCFQMKKALDEHHILKAIVWSAASVIFSVVYSWFFVFALLWIASVWGMWMLKQWRADILWGGITMLAIAYTGGLVWLFPERLSVMFQTLLRSGMGYTRMIHVSAMILAAVCWLVIWSLYCIGHAREKEHDSNDLLWMAWLITIACWCSNVTTGLYIQNDHFRIFVLFFSWMSAFVLLTRESDVLRSSWKRMIAWAVLLFSLGMSLVIMFRPYAFDGDQLNTIHLFVWISLIVSALRLLFSFEKFWRGRMRSVLLLVVACVIGFLPYVVMFQKEANQLNEIRSYDLSVAWIQDHIPQDDSICVDPRISEEMAAFSGHSVFFTTQSISSSGEDTALYRRLAALASLTDVSVSSTEHAWTTWLTSRGTACQQYNLYRKTILSGMSRDGFDDVIGCPRERMDAEVVFIHNLSKAYGIDDALSKDVCKWLVFPVDASSHWHLDDYKTIYQDPFIRIEQLKVF